MILRRLAEALRRQDWFVVLIEVAVVVLGIFIGLRVDDWNEARKNRSDELRYLAQVHEDLEAMRLEITDEMTTRQERIGVMRTALDAVERCVDSGEAADALRYTFQIYQTANSINVLDATYNEMREAGAIARIPDQGLKRELVYAFGALGATMGAMSGSSPPEDE